MKCHFLDFSLPTSIPVQIPVNQILDLLYRVYNIYDVSFVCIKIFLKNRFFFSIYLFIIIIGYEWQR
jgi:hypothetical protein